MRSAHRIFIAAAAFALAFSAIPAFAIYPISTVTFADANTGYLGGQYGNSPRHGFLSVTHDGGATWHATTMDNTWPVGLAVTSASKAFAAHNEGDKVITTSDTGTSWTQTTPIAGPGRTFSDIAATAGGGVLAAGRHVGSEYGDIGVIYKSANGLAPWNQVFEGRIQYWTEDADGAHPDPRPLTYAKESHLAMAPDGTVGWYFVGEWDSSSYAVGADWKGQFISKTGNGGSTWATVTPVPATSYPMNDAVAVDATHAFAVGPMRHLLKTVDGSTWTRSDLPRIGVSNLNAYGIDATDANHLVVVGVSDASQAPGAVQWTTNGGTTWSSYTATGFPALRSVSMITPTKWIVVGDNETIGRTTNAGATWSFTQLMPPTVALTTPSAYPSAPSIATLVSGTAADAGAGVASVQVSVRRDDGTYWNGISWASSSTTAFWNAASTANGWNTWTWNWQPDSAQGGSHTYQVTARATDAFGQTAESIATVMYTITPAPAGANGTISPATVQTVNSGGGMTFTITPKAGYRIANVLRNGVSVGASSSVTFAGVTSNQTLSATFAINTYTITPTAGANGAITPNTAQTVNHGTSKTFSVVADPGYHIVAVLKDGVSVGALSSVTFANVTANHTLSATFALNPANTYTITPTAGAGGTITPGAQQVVTGGDAKSFAIAANPGYHIVDVLKDGVSVGASSSVTFANVAANHTLSATFAVNRTVKRVEGRSRYDVAANLARKGWDPADDKSWTGVTHVIVACGDNGKEADPLAAAGLAGVYDSPILLTGVTALPPLTKTALTEIAKANPQVKIHLIGGVNTIPDARWTEIASVVKAATGVTPAYDRIWGRSRYDVSAAIANRMVSVAGGAASLGDVLIVAGDDVGSFYDALAASPISYSQSMPILSVQKGVVPPAVATILSTTLKGKKRYVVNSSTYVSDATKTKVGAATRLATSSNRYTAASQIANASIKNGWLDPASTAVAAKLPDALTGGVFSGKNGGVMLFTDSTPVLQTVAKSFITTNKAKIVHGWVFGGIISVPTAQETSFGKLLE